MNSQSEYNSYNIQSEYNNNYNYSNNNYDQKNNNYTAQNNDYNYNYNTSYDQYNNNYNNNENIIKYYNNYPVYSYIPPSYHSQEKNEIQRTNSNLKENENKKKGIFLKIKKEDMCYLRPPEYQPGYIPQQYYGKPKYAENPPQ